MRKWWIVFGVSALIWACAEQPKEVLTEKKEPKHEMVNGVVRSELAKTMRDLYNQLKITRDSLRDGYTVSPSLIAEVERIHTDTPTEADKKDETYHAYADLFINAYKTFEVDTSGQVASYNAMIETCVACHQQKCPGPVKTIKKLRVKE